LFFDLSITSEPLPDDPLQPQEKKEEPFNNNSNNNNNTESLLGIASGMSRSQKMLIKSASRLKILNEKSSSFRIVLRNKNKIIVPAKTSLQV
jgi:hypothetical protein